MEPLGTDSRIRLEKSRSVRTRSLGTLRRQESHRTLAIHRRRNQWSRLDRLGVPEDPLRPRGVRRWLDMPVVRRPNAGGASPLRQLLADGCPQHDTFAVAIGSVRKTPRAFDRRGLWADGLEHLRGDDPTFAYQTPDGSGPDPPPKQTACSI